MIPNWKWVDITKKIAFRKYSTGEIESIIAEALPAGVIPDEPDPPPPPTKDELDLAAVRNYQKLRALVQMSPTEISSWIDGNINTLAEAKDGLKTLAIGLSILARRIL